MSKIIEYFKAITAIAHCSESAEELLDYLVSFGTRHGYTVQTDTARNILASKGNRDLCFQSHYDMVCMGRAPSIEIVEDAGWMHAVDASLGADNGIGIAMMMALMEEGIEAEFLFTSDEEIGLIGASSLDLDVHASRMLNLDSEEAAKVTIGCAGGADIIAEVSREKTSGTGLCYEVAVRGLPGGHSGVDIDKGIPSAIKVLFAYLYERGVAQIASVIAGQRRNAIPTDAIAIVRSETALEATDGVTVRVLDEMPDVYVQSKAVIDWVYRFKQGVRSYNNELGIPQTSINLARINDACTPEGLTIEISARAMSMEDLDAQLDETVRGMEDAGFSMQIEDKYPAWRPEKNALIRQVAKVTRETFGRVEISAIHAGLECGVLSEKLPGVQFASIGPTIRYPHSTREKVDLASVERTFAIVRAIAAD